MRARGLGSTWTWIAAVLPATALFLVTVATPRPPHLQLAQAASNAYIAGILPPANPSQNTPESQSELNACGYAGLDESTVCTNAQVNAIDRARAQEGTRPLQLPSNWSSLTVPEQLFVLADLERVDRGLPPYLGLVGSLDQSAQQAASAGQDPTPPGGLSGPMSAGYVPFGGAWAGGVASPLEADYFWMYEDGWGGPAGTFNGACTQAGAPGCWAHRDELLGYDPGFNSGVGLECASCVMGAGFSAPSSNGWPTSYADLVVKPSVPTPSMVFTWAANVRPYLTSQVTGCVKWGPNPSEGYVMVGADGGAFAFGSVGFFGSLGSSPPPIGIVGSSAAPGNAGYWLVDAEGDVYSFGGAHFYGSVSQSSNPAAPSAEMLGDVVGIAATPDGGGYWIVDSAGDVFSFGDAGQFGSLGGYTLNAPVVGVAATPTGHGYWLVASDGGVFSFGDAKFYGSMGSVTLNAPVVGVAATPTGHGYWLVASDGGVFSFGDAKFYGSMGGQPLFEGVAAIVPTSDGGGYRMIAFDGGVFDFGNASYEGSAACLTLAAPIVSMIS
ncbi:MAG: hypothetical protein ACYDEP_01990 [Acidimicrobiales bacterium]